MQMLAEQTNLNTFFQNAALEASAQLMPLPRVIEIDVEELYAQPLESDDDLEELNERAINAHYADVQHTKERRYCRKGW